MTLEEYRNQYKEATQAPGRQAIDEHLKMFYPKMDFRHYPVIKEEDVDFSQPQALEGVSILDSETPQKHRHLISYGLSELYFNEKAFGQEFSKWGFEFTFRIAPYKADEDEKNETYGDPIWAIDVMNNLAQWVYETRQWLVPNQFMPANGVIRVGSDTKMTGFLFVEDPELKQIETVHGKVQFLQIIGITQKELDFLLKNPTLDSVKKLVQLLEKESPNFITDLNRKSII